MLMLIFGGEVEVNDVCVQLFEQWALVVYDMCARFMLW
jgi:hypothetical protein